MIMNNYQSIIDKKTPIKVFDGHLVDVQGTLINSQGQRNEPLYQAMLDAQQNGEKIYIFITQKR